MSDHEEWVCPRDNCTKGILEHPFALIIEHIYGGIETVSGRNFNAEESREVADRVFERIFGAGQ